MDGDRIAQAMARIDAAARRIESAGAQPASGGGDPDVTRKYEVLRGEASAVLAELDRVIGSLET